MPKKSQAIPDLLACPFCGEHNAIVTRRGASKFNAECQICGVQGESCNTEDAAKEAWNNRVGAGGALNDNRGKQLCIIDWLDALAKDMARNCDTLDKMRKDGSVAHNAAWLVLYSMKGSIERATESASIELRCGANNYETTKRNEQ